MIDIEEYDKLPFRESRYQYLTRKYNNMYSLHKFEHSYYSKYYKIAERIIKNNIGKSFDNCFSYYCRKYPNLQSYFHESFNSKYRRGFYVDCNGNIQHNYRKNRYYQMLYKKTLKVKSYDYEEGYYNPITKQLLTIDQYIKLDRNWMIYFKKSPQGIFRCIINGEQRTFESKDYRYKRFVEDNRKKKEALKRKSKHLCG